MGNSAVVRLGAAPIESTEGHAFRGVCPAIIVT